MNLQQLRYLSGIVEHGLNVSKAAAALHTSQPGVSRQIKLLEEELRAELLVRQGNRITALTDAGQAAAEIAGRILRDLESLRAVGADFADLDTGTLVVATTHVHAKYLLLPIVKRFRQRFPNVSLVLRQGTPDLIFELVRSGAADVGLSTTPTSTTPEVAGLACYRFHRAVLVPSGHALLARRKRLTLADVAAFPMINLDSSFSSGVTVLSTLAEHGLRANVVVTATDAEVIKAYVAAGLGIATLPEVAYDAKRDVGLKLIAARHLFPPSISYVWVHRHRYLRRHASEFIRTMSPVWERPLIERAMHTRDPSDPDLAIEP
jgi:LysR family cys regulon transcriptional activator